MPSKIPPHAQRVFKGEIFDVYQWPQEMYDGSTATFECLKRPNTVLVIAMQGDEVLYAEQEQPGKKPFLSLFGGRAEEGEEPLETAKRELLEETGMVSDIWEPLFSKTVGGKIDWTIYYFIARGCRKVQEPRLDPGEKITLKSTTVENFLKDVVPHPTFSETELSDRIYSAYNAEAATEFMKTLKA